MSKKVLATALAAAVGATGCTIDPARLQRGLDVLTGDACTSAGGKTMHQWEAERNVRGGHNGLRRAFVENNGEERFNLPVVKGSAPIAVVDRYWQGNATADIEGAIQNAQYCYGAKVTKANEWGQNGYSVQPAPRRR